MGNKNIKLTSQLIQTLETKLKKELKSNYSGLWSIVVSLVNTYFYIHSEHCEYQYFTDYKALLLAMDLWIFLSNNIPDKNFNYEKSLKQAENDLQETKTRLYNRWINNDLNKILLEAKLKQTIEPKNEKLQYKIEMLEDLLKRFPKYKKENDWEFKEAIGL